MSMREVASEYVRWQFAEVKTSENAQNRQCRGKRAHVSVLRSLSSQTDTNNWTIASNDGNRYC
ncbi:hypothetical protein D917_06939 [Trichinella nativa]|uniref:Uncharacterized protein n=1 Tax=Trichinella nativa TaxID=6335 RepID=A0A1Y3EQL1_9BILA|nr:hypothetical protein D917_06939 [Trichinella nativa]